MLLVYTPKITNRLFYTLNVVLHTILRVDFSMTTDRQLFAQHSGTKLSYASEPVADEPFFKACRLLFETAISDQEPRPFDVGGTTALFPVYGRDIALPYDPFAASFYLLSRYEEYLPHREDEHGRYLSAENLAVRHGFVNQASVDRWAIAVRDVIAARYPDFEFPERKFNAVVTVDIDAAYNFLHKGVFRTVTGLARDMIHRDFDQVSHRLRVLRHREPDPFDTFDYIIDTLAPHRDVPLVFFALMADYGMFDKPIAHTNTYFRQLLQHLGDFAKVGIHPSYYSPNNTALIATETRRLSDTLHRSIVRSRFHFLRQRLPASYQALLSAGIKHDYSMGFADITGFRAGTGTPFPFFDLESDCQTELTLHPFCVMDTTLQKYLALGPEQAMTQNAALIDELRAVGGTFSCIVHNQNLAELYGWQGWRRVFEQMCNDLDSHPTAQAK
ncbi:MAG: polysaccharide deacetylase family protein [Bacteroidales bacterium]|nr:polysaccharide deacetylase family protein [Bacteroidales bacterium]